MVKHLTNVTYPCQNVFDETSENDEVYAACGKPLLELALNGGIATCFMYGQTGSGKVHFPVATLNFRCFLHVSDIPSLLCRLIP